MNYTTSPLLNFENKLWQQGLRHIAGVDEAGRGPLAGPVVAAAVIFPRFLVVDDIDDSKKLSEHQRSVMFEIIQHNAISIGIGMIDEKEIDTINILQATLKAMTIALKQLSIKPDYALIDGRDLPNARIPMQAIIKGDQLSQSIAAASIIAKVTRDRLMCQYAQMYPEYGFDKHKGYPTRFHVEMIKKYGLCAIHRRSFRVKGWD